MRSHARRIDLASAREGDVDILDLIREIERLYAEEDTAETLRPPKEAEEAAHEIMARETAREIADWLERGFEAEGGPLEGGNPLAFIDKVIEALRNGTWRSK